MLTNLQTDLINLEISLGEATKNILDSISAEQIENSTSAQINDISWNIASHFPRRRETWTSGKASAIVSYLPRTGTDELTLEMIPAILAAQATNQTTYEIRYVTKPFSLNLSISFEYSTTNPNHLILKKIDSHNIYLPIGSIAEGREVTSVMSGLNTSCTLEGRTGYITNSRIFTDIKVGNNDNFIHIKVNYDTDKSAELIFGRLRNSLYENVPLGLVAFKGLFGVGDVWYDMEKGHIDGRRYPLEENTAQEVINLLAGKNTNSLDAAHSIATGLLSSSNSSSQQEGRLIWAITNLVKHLDNQASGTTLGGLLNKLNVTDSGRDIFDWTAELTRDISHNGLTLAGLAGLYEIQNYFANSSDSLDNAIIASLTKIEELLYYASALTDTDTIAEIGWYGDFIKFQKKDIYGLKAKMHTLRFLLNFVSAHNLDVANATIDSIVDPKTTANVYDFKTLVERYSRNDMNAEKDSIQDQLEAIDVLKSDANALTLKTGGQTMLNTAKSQLSLACESILKFFTAIESLSGGAKDSAYYMDGEEYESLTNYKKEFLSIWNNLNKTYHTTIGIGESIGNNNWYNLTTPTGKTSFHAIDSTTTTTSNFDYNFIFYGNEEDSFYERQEFTKVDLTQLFNGSLRDSFLGSSNLSSINNDDGLEAYHKDNPNDLIKRFLPDAVLINETEKEYAELRNTLIFSTEKTFVLTMDWSALSSVWSEIEKIWVVTSIEQIASIEKPENAEGNWEYNLSVPDGGARPVRLIIKRNDGENILYSEQSVFWTPWNSYKYVVQSTWFNIENTPISVLKLNYYDSIGGFE
jgi:hypothetical protein